MTEERINDFTHSIISRIHDNYNSIKEKSFTETLDSFRQISEDFSEFNNSEIDKTKYSSYRFDECTENEQNDFVNNHLQFVDCLVINKIYEKVGIIWNWYDIYKLQRQPSYIPLDKKERKVSYPTSLHSRPIGEKSWGQWNGFQIIDLDLKNKELALKLKDIIFDDLKQYNWFLGICLSASGNGIHIWTKITPIAATTEHKKIEFLCNFRAKYSFVYVVMLKHAAELGYTKEDIKSYIDMAMSKPQQGSFISGDYNSYLNTNFRDLRLDVNFEGAFDNGVESVDWIRHNDLKDIFAKLDWFNNDKFNASTNIDKDSVTNIDERDVTKSLGRRHYKHSQRWQLANTLNSLYGFDKALQIMTEICDGTPYQELQGDVKTASIHNKPMTIWAVKELNKQHGFNIKMTDNTIFDDELAKIDEEINKDKTGLTDPIKILNDKTKNVTLHINHTQYLSDIKDEIFKNLGKITLLEAGAGYGKTEMIKSLKGKTMLILPFTSTIKAKVESSETTKDWLYYYGNKRPSLEDLMSGKSMSMTIDKFSRLNVMELDQSNFEYIVIDESHLLFTSSYRDVMSPCIQRLANCKAKIIMMTGTPTGELLFFPNIKHIKVIKEDLREKIFELHMCNAATEQMIEMCKAMANDIIDGRKILFPTNNGNLYFEQITGIIQKYLDLKKYNKKLNAFYYKKSNTGDEAMDSININKSIGSNDIVFCTTYLSVGVDICDRYTFSVYFNEPWIPQDLEQFANRLRNNDLYLKLFLPKKDSMGFPINYYYTEPLDLSFDKKDMLFFRDIIKTCNDMLERNQEESKYSPVVSSILTQNRCLKYDENDCKYYIDETTYKLKVFEERYSDYSKQLEVMLNGIKYYGYKVDIIQHEGEITEDKLDQVKEYLKACRHIRYNYITNETFIFLDHINDGNIDYYKEILKGSYEIFRSEKYEEDRINNGLYCKDIEILEKNLPIVLGLYRFYDCETIKEIFEYCVESKQNKINYSKLEKIRKFVRIEASRLKSRLDFPVLKFITDASKWAEENPATTIDEITKWQAIYAAKYANSVKDVVVDDQKYFEKIFELIQQLWGIVIIQSKKKRNSNEAHIAPFELLWEKKTDLHDIYGGSTLTKDFFLQDLLDNIKEESEEEADGVETELPELPQTSKLKLEDVEAELPNIIHKEFNYDEYSELDGSNDRFMKKQENTNQLRDAVFGELHEADETVKITKEQDSLFDDDNDLPF